MCGIIGYVGYRNAQDVALAALEKLSYRGYDSAGICVYAKGLKTEKAAGKIGVLKERLKASPLPESHTGIGHTRWATHGGVSDRNSHPHGNGRVRIVHNGIIENYLILKQKLTAFGYTFSSETDTEVAALLIDYFYGKLADPLAALREAADKLKGSFALCVMFADVPDTIFALRRESPLLVGIGKDETFVASDIPAFLSYTNRYFRLAEGEIAVVTREKTAVYDRHGKEVKRNLQIATFDAESAERGGYAHFMRKEISEEKSIVTHLTSLYLDQHGFPFFRPDTARLHEIRHITIVGCGTAYHAGLYAKYLIEKLARVRCDCEVASEFRYADPILGKDDLCIFISQSGETADTISSLRMAKEKGATTIGIVNVVGSTIASEVDSVFYTYAGVEIAVASTKAYTAQCSLLALFALFLARTLGKISDEETKSLMKEFRKVPDLIGKAIDSEETLVEVAAEIRDAEDLFFIGRGADYPASLEASLKLKEISYIHSESYPAGELKHGTISLITEKTPVIALFGERTMREKMLGNLKEVAARGAKTVAVCPSNDTVASVADILIDLPDEESLFSPIVEATLLQLLAYHTAALRGCDIDQPRNLAKSVTVE